MSSSALVLAAHGSNADLECNVQVRHWARELAKRLPFDEVRAAFYQGSPAFAEVLDHLEATTVTVVPVMTSAGYYATQVLPRELARNCTYPDKRIRLTPPVGTHPAMVEMVRHRVRHLAEGFGFEPVRTTLTLVGHGTTRHDASRLATLALADKLRATEVAGQVLVAFLDDEPKIPAALKAAGGNPVVVVPFFIGAGMHPSRDVPAAFGSKVCENRACVDKVGASVSHKSSVDKIDACEHTVGVLVDKENSGALPREEILAGRRFIFDRPVGCDEGAMDIIADLASESLTAEAGNQRRQVPQHHPSPGRKSENHRLQQACKTRACHGEKA